MEGREKKKEELKMGRGTRVCVYVLSTVSLNGRAAHSVSGKRCKRQAQRKKPNANHKFEAWTRAAKGFNRTSCDVPTQNRRQILPRVPNAKYKHKRAT